MAKLTKTGIVVFLFLLQISAFIPATAYAQHTGRKISGPFPPETDRNFKPGGWFLAPGFTYMLPQRPLFTGEQQAGNPGSKFGLYFQFGRYRILRYWYVFKLFDYGLAYKGLRGKDKATGGAFGDHFVSAHADLTHILNLSDYSYLGNAIGLNADYAFIRNSSGGLPSLPVVQLHYKLSYGWKATEKLMIIPSLETPVFNIWAFEPPKSTLAYLGNRYRPIVFSVKFLFLNKDKQKSCPPVYNPMEPSDMDLDGH